MTIRNTLDLELLLANVDKVQNSLDDLRVGDGKFHPSSFGGCERKLYYAYHKTPGKNQITPGLRRTFDHGHKVHSWIQDKLLKAVEIHKSSELSDLYKPNCEINVDIEVNIKNTKWATDHNVSGSADALVVLTLPNGLKYRVVYELKTSASKTWDTLRSPLSKHVLQANTYAACLEADEIIFEYYNKDKDCSKYFYVQPDLFVQKEISDTLYNVMLTCTAGQEVPRQQSSWECDSCQYKYVCIPNE